MAKRIIFTPVLDSNGKQVVRQPQNGEWAKSEYGFGLWDYINPCKYHYPIYTRSEEEMPVPEKWRTGYYQVTLRVADRGGKFTQRNRRTAEGGCYFVVRPAQPGRDSRILLQLSTNTYNAYNNWGGFSLYAFHGQGGNQGHRVSFQRPPWLLR